MLKLQQPNLDFYRKKNNIQGSYTIPQKYEKSYKMARQQLHYLHMPVGVGFCLMYEECFGTPDSFLYTNMVK